MRIVAISRVVDEVDIVEAFVRHTACFVDHHIFMDNGSRDGTLQILSSLHEEGFSLSVVQNKSVSFNEADHLTYLFRRAITAHGADWVACLDVDEFLDERFMGIGLAGLLEQIEYEEPAVSGISLPLVDYIATHEDVVSELIVPVRIRRRREPLNNRKVIVRGGAASIDVEIMPGGHDFSQNSRIRKVVKNDQVRLAHYSERSPFQYLVKFIKGWSKVLAAGASAVAGGFSYHYRCPYETLRDNPSTFLYDSKFMGFKNEAPGLIDDPISYAGGTLRYTSDRDEAMRAVRSLMGTLQDLALRHGELLDHFPAVRSQVADWDSTYREVIE